MTVKLLNTTGSARAEGADVTELDLRSLAVPVYDGDTTASISQAHQAFDETGALKDVKQMAAVERVARSVLKPATKV